jgi:hypothetical protein
MHNTPTPGQIAYAAYLRCFGAYPAQMPSTVLPGPWVFLSPLQQQCWEAAAQAVLAMKEEGGHEPDV